MSRLLTKYIQHTILMKINSRAYLPCNIKGETIPYTYSITHKATGIHYYGSRYCKGCSPEDLFKTYFTSCKIIHDLIERESLSCFVVKVRKTFENVNECIEHENRFLKRVDAKNNPKFFNRNNETILVYERFNWITNGSITIKWPLEKPIPSDFKIGRHFERVSPAKGRMWIHNPMTKEFLMIDKGDPIPVGFVKGRGEEFHKKHSNTLKNKKMRLITNGSENKYITEGDDVPEGWRSGKTFRRRENLGKRSYKYIWINDGVNESHLKLGEEIPKGWEIGRAFLKK